MLTIRIAAAVLFLIPCANGMESIEDFLDYKNLFEEQSVANDLSKPTFDQKFIATQNWNESKKNFNEIIKRCEKTTKNVLRMTHRVDETNQRVTDLNEQIKRDLEIKNDKKVGTSSSKTETE